MANAVIESRSANAIFDLHGIETAQDIFVDGVSQAGLGYPMSRLVFHITTSGPVGDKVEQRKAVLSMTINTLVLVQLCQQTWGALAGNKDQIMKSADEFDKQFKALFETVPKP